MRSATLVPLLLLALPAVAAAQSSANYGGVAGRRESPAIEALSDTRRLALLPSEAVGFRVLGTADQARTLRVSTGHLRAGRLYHTAVRIVPRDGSAARFVEGTVSAEVPAITIGDLPAGEYTITVHLEDYATGATRDARNKVVLR